MISSLRSVNTGGAAMKSLLCDERGTTTVGMVVAMLVTLSLVFSAAQVYRVNARAADIQDVADAAALAAQNEVAEFMIAVKVCDAVVLSLSLASLTCTGLGTAALLTPITAPAGEALLDAGMKLQQAKSTFATKAANGLNAVQQVLPLLCVVNAASTAAANNGPEHSFLAVAIPCSLRGEPIQVGDDAASEELMNEIQQEKDQVKQQAAEAERLAQEALTAKQEGYQHDCGANPSYCLFERADHLGGLPATQNPLYHSVDAWSFSVALRRAQAYYAHRSATESPAAFATVADQSNAALRKLFYIYANGELAKGYVHETENSFEAYFPDLPTTTQEMRLTSLYTQASFPVTQQGESLVMHAWEGCPNAGGFSGYGSVAEMEAAPDAYATCPACGFCVADLGQVAQASARIDNGFEYHYLAIKRAAEQYEKARLDLDGQSGEVRDTVGQWVERLSQLLEEAGSQRLEAKPPGSFGCIAMVVDTKALNPSTGLDAFASYDGAMGARAAIAGATMIEESSGEGASVISSLLDGVKARAIPGAGIVGRALECWSALLEAYTSGEQALEHGLESVLNQLPLGSASGLGTWAASKLRHALEAVGLQPANTNALKPVIVNTGRIASADEGSFGAHFLAVKQSAQALGASSTDVLGTAVSFVEWQAIQALDNGDGTVTIATIEPFGNDGPSFPITIALPAPSGEEAGLLAVVGSMLSGLQSEMEGVRIWR